MATAFIHLGPDRRPAKVDTVDYRAVPGIILAVERHRRRTAQILDGIDDLGRAVVVAGVTALAEDRVDAASLVAHLIAHLRAGDVRLEQFVAELAELSSAPSSGTPMAPPRTDHQASTAWSTDAHHGDDTSSDCSTCPSSTPSRSTRLRGTRS
jgi:hypothetical protein